ncbi:MAG: ABC transporter ATP-binding protein [Syntrophomonadales bacterium]
MAILEVKNVSQEFGGLRALDRVNIAIEKGEIFGLIGPNGAGKTTLFNLITGIYRPTSGEVLFEGRSIGGIKPHRIAEAGIGRTFQNIRLFKKLSALDNVRVGMHSVSRAGFVSAMFHAPWARKQERITVEKSMALLELVGLGDKAIELAGSLPYGEQRCLEIARAMALEPALILLDEPAAGMNATEKEELLRLIRKIQEMGVTVLLVEHDMNVVMNICHRIAVLDYGRKIAEGEPEQIKNDQRVIESYLGVEM